MPRFARHFPVAIVVCSLLFLPSCQTLQQLTNIQKPLVNVDNVRFTALSFDAVTMMVDVKVTNPNPLAINLNAFDFDLQFNESSLVSGQQDSGLSIASGGESIIEIPLTFQFADLYNLFSSLKGQDQTTYNVAAGLSFNLPVLGATRVPVSKSGDLPLVKRPSIDVGALKMKKLSLTGADLELEWKVNNPNAFGLLLNKINYGFSINGKQWASGLMDAPAEINEKGEGTFVLPISLNFIEMGRAVYNIVAGNDPLDYQFTGNIDLGTSLPLLQNASLPINAAGQINIRR